ncbi:hypothetical protein [Deinococcus sp. QL22]|uniref:hypothetical protein n=1 Tax=Deinococcus sp. QL22 TaxID=2939437 RepID=UPI002016B500|nr:hypothetical protein [Deinococcus sp. QL22]UQN04869.1 hypothetical protein M1R55_08005 [Deinococcus sp. QL22]
MAILQDQYLLDVNHALTQLKRVDAEMIRITAVRNINLNTTSVTRALSQVATLRTQLNGLGSANVRTISIRLNAGNLTGLPGQLALVEKGITRVTTAAAMNLGVTSRLTGVFGFIPGPIGLFAAAATTLTGALTGLTAAQSLNSNSGRQATGGISGSSQHPERAGAGARGRS